MLTARIESVYSNRSYAYNLSSSDEADLNSVLHSYFGNFISTDKFDSLMRYYGISATGDIDKDVQALYNAMYVNASSQLNSKIAQNQQPDEVSQAIPWTNVMSQVGLAATGELAQDKEAFYNKISELQQSKATSNSQMANINQLLAEAGIVFTILPEQSQQQFSTVSGADITALINKQFFFGGNMSA